MGFAAKAKAQCPLLPQGLLKFHFSLWDLSKILFFGSNSQNFGPTLGEGLPTHPTGQGALKTGKNLWNEALEQGCHPEDRGGPEKRDWEGMGACSMWNKWDFYQSKKGFSPPFPEKVREVCE